MSRIQSQAGRRWKVPWVPCFGTRKHALEYQSMAPGERPVVGGLWQAISPQHNGRGLAMKRYFCGLTALALLVGLAAPAKAQPTYVFTTIDVPASTAFAHGINASGRVAEK
jgi:hypothetical protein